MLVFIDETGTDRRDAMRRFGYSLRGQPAKTHKLLVRGKHITAIVAICVEGILACKIVEESVTGEVFEDFFYTCLLPKLSPFNGENAKSVVIMDNASVHHVDSVVETFQQLGVLIHFLPPYSPDLNPIEESFSKLKSVMWANEQLLDSGLDIEALILTGLSSITSDDCIAWINNAGYTE